MRLIEENILPVCEVICSRLDHTVGSLSRVAGCPSLCDLPSVPPAESVKVMAAVLRAVLGQAVEETGLPSTGELHSARHSFASHLIGTGAPITAVRVLLGHAELTRTYICAHTTTDVRENVGKLDSVGISASPRKQEGAVIEEVL